jgi:hypothetical protein
MPSLRGHRENHPLNIYDSFSPRELTNYQDLFLKPSGGLVRTNVVQCGSRGLSNDSTGVIANWYARTNAEPTPTWNAWTHSAIATFYVGDRWYWQLPIADLLTRCSRPLDDLTSDNENRDAANAYGAFYDELGLRAEVRPDFDRLEPHLKAAWFAAATAKLPLAPTVVIGVRAPYRVAIQADADATRALIESTPDMPPLFWVHLEGLSTRTVS